MKRGILENYPEVVNKVNEGQWRPMRSIPPRSKSKMGAVAVQTQCKQASRCY